MKKLLLLLGPLVFVSCEKEIDFEIPNPGNRIVIDARLVSGENTSALLSTSTYSLSNEEPTTNENMRVALFENGVFRDSLRPTFNQDINQWVYYSLNYVIQSQKTYTIKASYGGLPEASATNHTPLPIEANVGNVKVTAIKRDDDFYTIPTSFSFTLAENSSTEDYYRISLSQRNGTGPVFFSSSNPVLTDFYNNFDFEGDDGRSFFYYAYLSDKDLSNAASTLDIVIEDQIINDLYLCVEHITKDYFEHERTKALAQFGGDGFSEPVQIFSNVKNGYGIVAGSTPTFTKIER